MPKRSWRGPLAAAVTALLLAPSLALAQVASTTPGARGPVRLLAGFPPGGGVDILARLFAERLAEATGRPVVVDNRPGAGGRLATELLRAATADGNTLMLAPDATVILQPQAQRQASSPEPVFDLTPIAHTGAWSMGFAVAASAASPVVGTTSSGAPLIADLTLFSRGAKANSAVATFASGGAGGSTHLYGLLIAQALAIPLRHVPYKGAAPAVADLMAGHVASTVQPLGTLLVQARAGRIAIVAASGTRRSAAAPEVPTFAESGYPGLIADFWFGLFAPPGTSPEVSARINTLIVQSMRTPGGRERMRTLDLDIREMTAPEFAAQVQTDWRRWGDVIRSSGFNGDSE